MNTITQVGSSEFELEIGQEELDGIIEAAEAGRAKIAPDDFEMARAICNNAQFVWAVWPDRKKPGHVGLMLIKATDPKKVRDGGQKMSITGFPCENAKHARALQRFLESEATLKH
jgi:hypothetical protein